ncbi:MAG: prolipoprotein diacylglyceryl transferase [Opitutaceae bacterium]
MPLAYWVDRLSPFLGPHWGNIGIRYYGLGYLIGFAAAWVLLRAYARAGRARIPEQRIGDLIVACVIGTLLGGRLGYFLLYQPGTLFHQPLAFFEVWQGGMASHGGMIGVAIALAWFARKEKAPFLHVGDLVVSAAPIGIFVVRIANFINGELWGKISTVPWAMIFPRSAPPGTPLDQIPPRHPSQLYEAGLEGLLLLALMQWRFWKSPIVRTQPGRLSGEFLLAYAIVRIFGERFREPDVGISLILGMSRGTFYSLFLIVAGIGMILWARRHRRTASGG